jgi:hypothetical protein
MKALGYIALGFALMGFGWIWVASLINHACYAWWAAREGYRKRMDNHVKDMLDEEMSKFN